MMTASAPLVARLLAVALPASPAAARRRTPAPPVATPTVTLSHDKAPLGSPLDSPTSSSSPTTRTSTEDYRVMVHVVDADEELMWTDDHNPPMPTTQWKPGQTVEYTRTIFVPVYPVRRRGDDSDRPVLDQTIRSAWRWRARTSGSAPTRSRSSSCCRRPRTCSRSSRTAGIRPKSPTHNAAVEWQWTKKEATLAFKNPKKDACSISTSTTRSRVCNEPQQVQVTLGGQAVDEFTLEPEERGAAKDPAAGGAAGHGGHGGIADLGRQDVRAGDCDRRRTARIRASSASACSTRSSIHGRTMTRHGRCCIAVDRCASCSRRARRRARSSCSSTSGRTLSVKAHRVDGDSLVLVLRGGGEIVVRRRRSSRASRRTRCRIPSRRPAARRRRADRVATPDVQLATIRATTRSSTGSSAEQGVDAKLVRARDPGRVGLPGARAVAEGRDGADAADAAKRRGSTRSRRSVRSGVEHRSGHQASASRCSIGSRCSSRWRRTTPAKRPCSGSAAFRRTRKRATTSRASSQLARPVASTARRQSSLSPALHGLSRSGQTAAVKLGIIQITNVHADNLLRPTGVA